MPVQVSVPQQLCHWHISGTVCSEGGAAAQLTRLQQCAGNNSANKGAVDTLQAALSLPGMLLVIGPSLFVAESTSPATKPAVADRVGNLYPYLP